MGTYCTSAASCWAVGSYDLSATVALNEVLHWNGSRWRRMSVPNPAGTANGDDNILLAVRCARATDCWAVGVYQVGFGAEFGQALHWNGKKWVRAAIPEPGADSGLSDVVCPSSSNCWAVGLYELPSGAPPVFNEALHWNGKKWALASTPQPGGTAAGDLNFLSGVRCPSASTCFAVGTAGTTDAPLNQVLRWNGSIWSTISVPSPGGTATDSRSQLFGLGCSSIDNCWAVGSYNTAVSAATFNQVLHWNGSAWSQIDVPEPGGSGSLANQELRFATCSSAINCWAVGDFSPAGSTHESANQALHWDGGTWSVVRIPDPAGGASGYANRLNAVRCVTAKNCWAVGTAQVGNHGQFGQVLHWGGARWSVR
jgi:hypothetical protein